MRRWIIGAFFSGIALAGGYALAQIVPALPFQLQNNTVADATQVMANFNQILNNVNSNAAKNGANSDITSLLGLTTPLAPSVGGTTTYTGGTSTGTANAQVVATVVPSTFTLAVGRRVVFVALTGNTAAMTVNVAGSGVKNVLRQTTNGMGGTVGGEVTGGGVTELVYDGTAWQIVGGPPYVIGEIKDYPGTGAPPGWLLADGSCQSQATYSGLFNILSTTWGSCGAGQFALPDYRGRVAPGKDDMGGTPAFRLTIVGGPLASTRDVQSAPISQANLPNVNFTNSGIAVAAGANLTTTNAGDIKASTVTVSGAQGVLAIGGPGAAISITNTAPSISAQGSAASGGSGTAFPTVQPSIIVNKIIKL